VFWFAAREFVSVKISHCMDFLRQRPSITDYVEKARCRRHSAPGFSFRIASINPNALTHDLMIINRPKKTLKFVIT
jgi:hypothetical protein